MRLKRFFYFGFCTLILVVVAGCMRPDSLEESFSEAPPSLRQSVDEAVRLDRNNDWMTAAEAYDRVLREALTPEQEQLVQRAIQLLYSRMTKAARTGDSQARLTLEQIEQYRKGS
ncbi:MAG TPA: hypothetical protein VEH04_11225 [Verrucomicrobiae bacterium]|nr:hypothetical protein [Verrucomicrobiae bacterium]